MIARPSPNHGPRPAGRDIDMLVLHYTGMRSAAEALERLCDPAAEVSAHYMIDEDGTTYQIVPEERRAWHAGVSCWRGYRDINDRSIGIELVNPGHEFGYRPFAEAQMLALRDLSCAILSRHPIPPRNVIGHSDIAPMRKQDPGELFDWQRLADWGLGLWPQPDRIEGARPDPTIGEVQAMLARYGYDVPLSGMLDTETQAGITAFQRHFHSRRVDGCLDRETVRQLERLLTLVD